MAQGTIVTFNCFSVDKEKTNYINICHLGFFLVGFFWGVCGSWVMDLHVDCTCLVLILA